MSNKIIKSAMLFAAMAAMSDTGKIFDIGQRNIKEGTSELSEDQKRRERCEQMAIEKAKAKRERKAAKMRELMQRKEDK